MKNIIRVSVIGAGLFVSLNLLHAQTALVGSFNTVAAPVQPAASDSVVQIAAESAGLQPVAPADVPLGATYYWALPNGTVPMPFAPADDVVIYQVTANIFLADCSGEQIAASPRRLGMQAQATSSDVAAAATAQVTALTTLIDQLQTTAANQQMRSMAQAAGMDVPTPGGGDGSGSGDGGGSSSPDYGGGGGTPIDTNGLYLQITNVANGWSYGNLCNGTNQVYATQSATSLLSGWQVETELWPTNGTVIPTVTPFAVQNLDRQILFLRAMDWTGVETNGLLDWWMWMYFGNLNESATDLDSQGVNTLGYDYTNGLDPNVISFTVNLGNQNFNSIFASGQFVVSAGVPSYEAVLINDTNLNDAVWLPYDGNVTMNLGPTDGVYQVTMGLKGRATNSTVSWMGTEVTLNRQAPQITLTSPTTGTVAQPYLQVQGYAAMPLASLRYDFNGQTNQLGFIIQHTLDTNTFSYTTDYFQCYDLPLAAGSNSITLHATDPAGNTFTTNFTVTLNYSTASNPTIQLKWPQNGAALCGSSFTVRGWTEDAAAQVSATITDTNGDTNTITGIVERTGNLWAENLPLNPGTNFVSLVVTNAAGLSNTTNFTVVQSSMALAVTSITGDLWLPTASVSGTIADTSATISVNGIQGTNNGDGTWSAANVPVSPGGTASFDVSTVTPDATDPATSDNAVKPDETKLDSGVWHAENYWLYFDDLEDGYDFEHSWNDWSWSAKSGGGGRFLMTAVNYFQTWDFVINPDKSVPYDLYTDSTGLTYDTNGIADTDDNYWLQDAPQQYGAITAYGADPDDIWIEKSATVKVVFHTGGKAVAGQQSLYVVNGGVTQQVPGRQSVFATIVNGADVASQQVSVPGLGENLGSDGIAYAALPNPPSVDVTLQASVPRKYFPVGVARSTPTITANGNALDPDEVVTNADFCVGQGITFDITGLPRVYDLVAVWTLPGTFVNTNSDPNCDLFYKENAAFLSPPQGTSATQCWYVKDGLPLTASVHIYYRYTQDGKLFDQIITGQFNVHRPATAEGSPYQPDGTPTAQITNVTYSVWMGKTISATKLSLSLGDGNGHNDMSFSHTINPGNFSGLAGYVQLITSAYFENALTPPAPLNYTALDGALGEFPADRQTTVPASATTTLNKFYDGPAVPLGPNYVPVSEDVSFSTYLMFRPDPQASSIWVPLRLITWDVHDHADPTWTPYINNDQGTTTTNPSGNDHDSTAFPDWTTTY